MDVVTVAVLIGTALAVTVVVLTLRSLRRRIQRMDASVRPRWAVVASATAAVVSFPFAWWVAFVLGGNFGGALAAMIAEPSHAERFLVPTGIGIGIAMVTVIIVLALSLSAFWTMRLIERK